jgi:hypothetical protein
MLCPGHNGEGAPAVGSFIQQMPALIGVLIGAVATYAATAVTERARWRRSQSVRWDERRITAYAEYAHVLKQAITTSLRIATAREGAAGRKQPSDDEIAALTTIEDERTMKWEAVLLLGSSEVVVAARQWHQAAFRLQRLAYGKTSDMSLSEAIAAISQARRTFYEAAKSDIGIDIGGAPEAYEWQLSKAGSAIDATGDLNWFEHMTVQPARDS